MCIDVVGIVEGSILIDQREFGADILGHCSSERLISPSSDTLALCGLQFAAFSRLTLIESLLPHSQKKSFPALCTGNKPNNAQIGSELSTESASSAMNVLTDVWNELLSDTMLWIVGEGDRAGSTDEKIVVNPSPDNNVRGIFWSRLMLAMSTWKKPNSLHTGVELSVGSQPVVSKLLFNVG